MSIAVVDRRRVAAFADALETMETGPATDRGETHGEGPGEEGAAATGAAGDPKLARALATAATLREAGEGGPTPTADFRAALRNRLVEEAATLPAPAPAASRGGRRRVDLATRQRTVRRRRRFAAAGTAMVLTAGGLGGIAVASSDALPGDMTYGIKRGIEDFRLSLAGSDRERGERYLDQARTRLAEAERLLEREGDGAIDKSTIGHLRSVLADMRTEAEKGRNLLTKSYEASDPSEIAPMRDLAAFARTGTERMDRIDNRLPGEVSGERNLVWDLLFDIRRQVTPIPGVLSPQDIRTFDDFDKTAAGTVGSDDDPVQGTGSSRVPGHVPGAGAPPSASGVPGAVPQIPGQAPTGVTGETPATPQPSTSPGIGSLLPNVTVPLLEPTPTATATPSPSPNPGVDINLPLPVLPPIGLEVPPLLPGLPGIGITIGGAPAESPEK
ncbi:DUF5667 domain-containing protein [Yinghuangia sp. ASG 101]|uniref:DUF5667 domain-containing protein n=1 Tax=Yinghuangia sp. ASG 101 TaxID=2896848 RepID=UPI001E4A2D23|nr:DUF5667 domain-containing protein [Yinghuangia sp. ASG 101]UGQ09220.1 DUF5667 domain-containing protein [Yinghuangia sp. ASG 101]